MWMRYIISFRTMKIFLQMNEANQRVRSKLTGALKHMEKNTG